MYVGGIIDTHHNTTQRAISNRERVYHTCTCTDHVIIALIDVPSSSPGKQQFYYYCTLLYCTSMILVVRKVVVLFVPGTCREEELQQLELVGEYHQLLFSSAETEKMNN